MLYVLGRQPEISLVELEALGANIQPLTDDVAIDTTDLDIDFSRLGGSIKQAKLLAKLNLDSTDSQLQKVCHQYLSGLQITSLDFGISWYGFNNLSIQFAVKLKKALIKSGHKARFILPQNSDKLDAAAIIHNKLAINHTELLIIRARNNIYIGFTVKVQDIDSYSYRDYHKPCRDSRVGMLPPKLAQTLINLTNPGSQDTVVDLFCGSGTLLMEAQLMGLESIGSDIDEKMVSCATANTEWIQKTYRITNLPSVTKADATNFSPPKSPYVIAAEGYLGKNFSLQPDHTQIQDEMAITNELYHKFFSHLRGLQRQPKKVVLAIPVWYLGQQVFHLDIVDQIEELGYTRLKFKSADARQLVFHRKGQFVGRQILVLSPK